MHYLDSGKHVGSETKHRVLISAEDVGAYSLGPEQRPRVIKPEPSWMVAHLNVAFLCVDHYLTVNYVFAAEVIPYREQWNRVTKDFSDPDSTLVK